LGLLRDVIFLREGLDDEGFKAFFGGVGEHYCHYFIPEQVLQQFHLAQ
jgi:hypothetical protein